MAENKLYALASTLFLMILALFLALGLLIAWLKRKAPQVRKNNLVWAFDQAFVEVAHGS